MTLRGGWASYLVALLCASGCGARPGGMPAPAAAVLEPPAAKGGTTAGPKAAPLEAAASTAGASAPGPAGNGAPSSSSTAQLPREALAWRSTGAATQLPRAAGRFVRVPVPAGPEIVSVSGRSPRDVWLLNHTNDVYRYDGRATRLAYSAICLEEPHTPGELDFIRPLMRHIAPLADGVLAVGAQGGANEIYNVLARLGREGAAECVSASGAPNAFAHTPTAAWLVNSGPFCGPRTVQILAGPRVPVPALRPECDSYPDQPSTPIQRLWMGSALDVWAAGPRIWQYQGAGWQDHGPVPFEVLDIWADERGTGWIIGKPGSKAPTHPVFGPSLYRELDEDHSVGAAPAVAVARFDGSRFEPVPVPEGFTATRVHGTAPDDVWFVGGPRAYHFDGHALRQTAMPLDGVWDVRAVDRDLWVVGYVSEHWSRKAPNRRQVVIEGDKRGAAVRLERPAQEGQP